MRPDLRRRRLYRGVGRFISIAVAIGMSVWRARKAKNVETYGSARWAERTIRAAGLLGPDGVVLGRSTATISAMTVRSMCCASHRRDRARASAWSCRRC
jgi:type IV secretory pathway TraG/TraD family ATPase VirD4